MNLLRRIGSWIVTGIVIICVTVVFNGIGKGFLDASGDDPIFFAVAATVVSIFLYRRHVASTPKELRRTDVINRAVTIGMLLLLLTIPSRIRAIPDATSDVSSIQEEVASLQDQIDALTDMIDSIEH